MYKNFFKRLIDIIFSFIMLIVFSPIFLIFTFLIKIDSKGPIIFRQKRLGKNEKEFLMYKFRSMVVGAETNGVYSDKGDARVTKIGEIIRKTSIDELPQLWNVLKGDMSYIGPRPPLTYHPWPIDDYSDFQRKMFNVRPGITGWAQINGRKDVEWNKRIELNIYYVEHLNLWFDLKILFTSFSKVILMRDNYNNGKTAVNDDLVD